MAGQLFSGSPIPPSPATQSEYQMHRSIVHPVPRRASISLRSGLPSSLRRDSVKLVVDFAEGHTLHDPLSKPQTSWALGIDYSVGEQL